MKIQREHKGQNLWAFPTDFTVVDIETTGMGEGMRIIEVSALKVRQDVVVDRFSTLIDPDCYIDPFITHLTGITNEMVQDAPCVREALEGFYDFADKDILMGHNVNFDVNALYDNLWQHNRLWLTNDYVDVLRLSRKALPDLPCHKQTYLAEYFGISPEGAHRALRDCELCLGNYLAIRAILQAN